MKKKPVFHPLLFALFPVLFLYARNMGEYSLHVIWFPLITTLVATMVAWALFSLVCRSIEKAALLISLFLAIFFSYGHIYNLLWKFFRGLRKLPLGVDMVLFPICLLSFILLSAVIFRWRQPLARITGSLNIAAIVLVAFSLITMSIFAVKNDGSLRVESGSKEDVVDRGRTQTRPNIFYIILDGYPRQDNLLELYGEDNAPFLRHLQNRGFFIAGKSYSNYSHTLPSLAATLNFTYLDDLAAQIGDRNNNRAPLRKMISHSKARTFLARLGYRFVALKSGYSNTEIRDADIYLGTGYATDFYMALMRLTPVQAFRLFFGLHGEVCPTCPGKSALSSTGMRARDRERILFPFRKIPEIADFRYPVFVLAHIVAPHPPFVFDEDGKTTDYQNYLGFENGDWLIREGRLTRRQFIDYFRQQLRFINKKVMTLVDTLLATSVEPPVIILQGDHGPGAFVHHERLEMTYIQDRMGILNAIFLPNRPDNGLTQSLSPVNTFRIIFNTYFSGQLPLLPNRHFYSSVDRPYRFIDVTDRVGRKDDRRKLRILQKHDYFPGRESGR